MQSQSVIKHCLSFDVEEHFQVSAFASPIRRRHWDSFTSRVEANTEAILTLLEDRNVRATFFILGWVAHRHPGLVKKLADKGHEIASHGYSHETITGQTPGLFREDVRRAKQILEDTIGAPVHGYRAPSFTITRDTQWALPVLVEEGYVYDSSIFPIMHDRYGMRGANPWYHQLQTVSGPIWEVPPSTLKIGGVRFPIAGGGYFRLYPYSCLNWMLKRASQQGPLVLYLHPWELDPEQPRMRGSLLSRFRHYVNLRKTAGRLSQLLEDFPFAPIREAIAEVGQACRVSTNMFESDSRKELKSVRTTFSLVEGARRG